MEKVSVDGSGSNIEKVLPGSGSSVLELKNCVLSQFNSETLREFLHHESIYKMQKRKFSPNPNIALRATDAKKRKAYRIRKRLSTFLSAREPKYMETGLSVTSLTSTPQVFA